jgi:hypothetical protein
VEPEIVNPLQIPNWDELILSHPDAGVFHSSGWARVLSEAYGFKPTYFASFNNGGVNAVLPFMDVRSILTGRRGVSLPFTDYCRPLLSSASDLHTALTAVIQHGKKVNWSSIQVRGSGVNVLEAKPSSIFHHHTLDLGCGETALRSALPHRTGRNITKAIKAGVRVTMETSGEALQQFCRLNDLTRRMLGLPLQPIQFYEKLLKHLVFKGMGTIALAWYGKMAIAGAIFLTFGDQVIYKYGAKERRYRQLCANNLIMWEAIRLYTRKGYRSFCFGRTEPDNDGLLQFKRGWGAVEETLSYYKYDLKQRAFVQAQSQTTGLHNRVFRAMPTAVLRLAGYFLYRHVA